VRLALLVLAWVTGSIAVLLLVGWRWSRTGLGRKYPGETRYEPPHDRCDCPLARDAERILQDGRLCLYPADGEDGLCAMCRFTCIPLLKWLGTAGGVDRTIVRGIRRG
jgi:hypothetical protein